MKNKEHARATEYHLELSFFNPRTDQHSSSNLVVKLAKTKAVVVAKRAKMERAREIGNYEGDCDCDC